MFLEEFHVFFHPPFCLIHAVLNGVADAREALKLWRKKTKVIGFLRGFDDQGIGQINSVIPYEEIAKLL